MGGGHLLEGGRLMKGGTLSFAFIINYFLQAHPNNFMIVEVTGPRRPENSLVVPGKFLAFTKSMAIGQKLKEQIMHIKELCKNMEMEITVSDFTEKKLFSYRYSDH